MLIATDSFSDAVNDMWLNKKTLEVKKKTTSGIQPELLNFYIQQ